MRYLKPGAVAVFERENIPRVVLSEVQYLLSYRSSASIAAQSDGDNAAQRCQCVEKLHVF